MANLKKSLKKICKKQVKKTVKKMGRVDIASSKQEKILLKKKNKKLAKKTYQELKHQLVQPTKKAIKQQICQTLNQIIKPLESQNDAVYFETNQHEPTVINIVTPDVSIFKPDTEIRADKPLKKKPCGGCPALKNGLCRCALKVMANNAKVS
ncbi:hypothetical protein D5R81_03385 [Parashewanella spongiae]|uniref:Uncharacterized protein n=1 Tax=Parashewanella spongiae TaxID=342950 RepID=A0A3A6UME9_9GAMM|nr:hypothetical protein [Parashewanella spongiae]MCL1078960.1 hypothetical protein [Parashewanella spongiae]RJY18898.1 hypothetical protein D5R81_03385 [Parashewanella spongiae]